MAEAKFYTEEEIDQLPLKKLEELAKNLRWEGTGRSRFNSLKGRYERTGGTLQHKTKGFQRNYRGKTITSREQYLRERLKASSQEVWNKDAAKALKKKREEAEAKKPKVSVKTKPMIELKDHRPKGHTFILELSGGKVTAHQKQKDKHGKVGRSICDATGEYTAQDFQDAIELISEIEMPKIPSETKGKAKLEINMAVVLSGTHDLEFAREGDIIGIRQRDRYAHERMDKLRNADWQFRKEDLLEVIRLLNSRFEVKIVEPAPAKAA